MSRFDISVMFNTFVTLVLNIGLVVGLYFVFTFIKKLITQGKFDIKYWEIIVGVLLIAATLFLKFSILFFME